MATTKGRKGKPCCKGKEQDRKEERRQLVAAALAAAWFESDSERESAIESFTKANLTISEILMLTEGLRNITRNSNKSRARIFGSNSRIGGGIA